MQAVSFKDAVAVQPQVALERGRFTCERDRNQQRERRRQDRELRASRGKGRHQRRRRDCYVHAQAR